MKAWNRRQALALPIAVVVAIAGVAVAWRAHGAGVPQTETLSYSGTLEEAAGPVTGARAMKVRVWKDAALITPGNLVCITDAPVVQVVAGRFRVPLDPSCTAAIHANPEVWVELEVGTALLPRAKISAVPYALQAEKVVVAHDVTLTGDSVSAPLGVDQNYMQRRIGQACPNGQFVASVAQDGTPGCQTPPLVGGAAVPPGAIMFFNLGACPTGWTQVSGAAGRYLVGLPAAGTLAGTAGTALTNLEDRPVGLHSHGGTTASNGDHAHTGTTSTAGAHSHTLTGDAVTSNNNCMTRMGSNCSNNPQTTDVQGNHNHTFTTSTLGAHTHAFTTGNSGTVAGTNAPYIQFLVCQKD